jgi:hypothetical protein
MSATIIAQKKPDTARHSVLRAAQSDLTHDDWQQFIPIFNKQNLGSRRSAIGYKFCFAELCGSKFD